MISWWHVAFSTSQDIDLLKQRYAAPLSGEYKLIIVNKLYAKDRAGDILRHMAPPRNRLT